ncbi:MAG: anti-sigma factor antagonist [SAR324 cluster bacterium]|nr:anti-sigma factor antagonist [SAR324 cluster bacterium]
MNITHRQEQNICIISLKGEMVWQEVQTLNAHVTKLLEQEGVGGFLVNLEKVTYLSSSALGVLMMIMDQCMKRQIPFGICSLNEELLELLKSTHLNEAMTIFETEEAAIATLSQQDENPQ